MAIRRVSSSIYLIFSCPLQAITDNILVISRPFIIDLESTNGTHVNGEAIPVARYYELRLNDGKGPSVLVESTKLTFFLPVIKFGTSNREFVLLHEDVAP